METKNVESFATLMGGAEVTVTKLDGTSEVVKVRQLAVKQFPALLEAQGDELAQAALYCDRPRDWVEQLAPASHELVIVEGERLNADFFGRWLLRQRSRLERVQPGLMEKLLDKALTSPGSLPKLPPNAA